MVEILVKPETLILCKEELEGFLMENGFFVEYKKNVSDWNNLSIALYEKSEKVTKRQLELQNIARNQMMGLAGSRAELWGLKYKTNIKEIDLYELLTGLKRKFRSMKWKEGLTFHIEYNGDFSVYHFTYFHVSDPETEIIESERLLCGRYIDEMGSV
ncbi:hypothetical protein [Filifactor villosus]|uniref:Uncharacterized protein n=1 Tax=Filifactor villosus TaxID=29374 RepID=A0ABV9QLY5_9FIRM